MSCKVISILNMKGGVGKTTLSVNLAWYLAEIKNKKILLVDLDPQFNASQYMLSYDEYDNHIKNKFTVTDILLNPFRSLGPGPKKKQKTTPDDFIFRRYWNKLSGGILDLIPSDLGLSKFVKGAGGEHIRLSDFIKTVKKNYDYIIIDCAPTESMITVAAFASSNFVLTPVTPDPFAIIGFPLIEEAIFEFKKGYADPNKVKIIGSIFTNVEEDATTASSKSSILATSPYTFTNEMRYTKYYRHSVKRKVPIYRVPRCKPQFKKELAAIAKEFVDIVGG